MLIWRGASQITGDPIVLVATGLKTKSTNSKTGAMVQTWILVDALHPQEALKSGADEAICGGCRHRGVGGKQRACYVRLQGPAAIWKALQAGRYEDLTTDLSEAAERVRGRVVRLGAYGDPAAVPTHVWKSLLKHTSGRTGYTHQWQTADAELRKYCMASVDTPQEYAAAIADGWRTFRVRAENEPLLKTEIMCPASVEAGMKTTCERCKLCDGKQKQSDLRKNIAIQVHGIGKASFGRPGL